MVVDQVNATHNKQPVDFFFSYFYDAHVFPEAIATIRDLGIPTMNWYANASYQFGLIREIAAAYDFCLEPERYRLEKYAASGRMRSIVPWGRIPSSTILEATRRVFL